MKFEIENPELLLVELLYINGAINTISRNTPELINVNKLINSIMEKVKIQDETN